MFPEAAATITERKITIKNTYSEDYASVMQEMQHIKHENDGKIITCKSCGSA